MTKEQAIKKLEQAQELIDEVMQYVPREVSQHCGNMASLATEELRVSIKCFDGWTK